MFGVYIPSPVVVGINIIVSILITLYLTRMYMKKKNNKIVKPQCIQNKRHK